VSRSWAGTVLAGVAGWLAALALPLAIAPGDTGNVLVLADGRLGADRLRATGRLDPLQQASMREMLVAVQ
jgi:hypothetical protein